MEAKRKDLKLLTKEGCVNIDPELVDELLDEAVQKPLDDYAKKSIREQQTAAILTAVGTVTENFGARGTAQLATDISNNPPILGIITFYMKDLLIFTAFRSCGLFAYKYFRGNSEDE